MTAIQSATQQIAATLRLQIATLGAQSQNVRSRERNPSTKDPSAAAQPEPDFAERIALRVQGVAIDDPLFKRKVLRIFLETVISAELGVSLPNDVRFSTMIDNVQRQMESDPELSSAIEIALKTLVPTNKRCDWCG